MQFHLSTNTTVSLAVCAALLTHAQAHVETIMPGETATASTSPMEQTAWF
jgi:hypothetical protein